MRILPFDVREHAGTSVKIATTAFELCWHGHPPSRVAAEATTGDMPHRTEPAVDAC